ncbi:hypothetical protein ILUMI_06972 [Ignelater luminosus]|uniref:Uncharacterized protein n=1 Tax=Ignelater luminosus TaxID=2038154 RepID=A0A8K0GGR1_IGNLU|nr:hypothetical protein ILUMI_06972 [Ignelater luminosus]
MTQRDRDEKTEETRGPEIIEEDKDIKQEEMVEAVHKIKLGKAGGADNKYNTRRDQMDKRKKMEWLGIIIKKV